METIMLHWKSCGSLWKWNFKSEHKHRWPHVPSNTLIPPLTRDVVITFHLPQNEPSKPLIWAGDKPRQQETAERATVRVNCVVLWAPRLVNQSESDEISVRNQPLGSASHSSTLNSSERWFTAISPHFTWNICSFFFSLNNPKKVKAVEAFGTVSDNRFLPAVYVCLFPVQTKQSHPAQSLLWRTGFHSLGARFYQQHQCWTCNKLLSELWYYTSWCCWMLLSNIWSLVNPKLKLF